MRTKTTITKPRTQRRLLFQAPDHIRHKHLAAILSPELRTSEEIRTIPIRNGDTVRIMRGDHRGLEGKVTRIDTRKYRIYVEGLTREKADGTTIFLSIHPSKVMIKSLNLEDKWRKQIIKRKKEANKTHERVIEVPSSKKDDKQKKPRQKPPKKEVKKRRKGTAKETTDLDKTKKTTKRSKSRKKTSKTKSKDSKKNEGGS